MLDFESGVVGTMLANAIQGRASTAHRMLASLPAHAFADQANRETWQSALAVRARKEPVTLLSVNEELRAKRNAEKNPDCIVADSCYLVSVCEDYSLPGEEKWLIETLRTLAIERKREAARNGANSLLMCEIVRRLLDDAEQNLATLLLETLELDK